MEGCLRAACPCMGCLWEKIFKDKNEAEGGGGGGTPWRGDPGVGPGAGPGPNLDSSAIYTAQWSFEARHPDELSFTVGDEFTIQNRNGDWWTAQKIDQTGRVLDTGIVPHNYLIRTEKLSKQPWFFGKMNRIEAQGHLMAPGNENGSFIIRQSEKDDIGLVISVKSMKRVKHFKIYQSGDSIYYVDPSRKFSSLTDLVDYYSTNNLINSGPLGASCKKKRPSIQDLSHVSVDEWELPKEDFTLREKLGSGNFADVYRGLWKNHISVAIKILKTDTVFNQQEFRQEVEIMKRLRHHHLLSLFAVCTASQPFYIITELMEKGSLLNFLRGPEGSQLDVDLLIDMAAQVADGMSYLEEMKSIHRDLAARNVLVGENYICKVADFGLARVIKEQIYITNDKKIPYKWTAPEAISYGMFSIKSDVWSFGVLLYEIITHGEIPYPAYNNQETAEQVKLGYRMPAPPKCPPFLYQIMLQCWSTEPADRPSFMTLKTKLENSFHMA
ncbi:protein-tyrosine kinase 6b [Pholidichthys leucotaenia]